MQMRDEIQAELDRIESRLSHWRPESETSQFNSSETTLELEYSSELVSLVEHGRLLGEATIGAYDITAGPLVEAWGYGPAGPHERDPTAEELEQLLAYVGWGKLEVQSQWQTLRKKHPLVQIDLGSLLQGYAVDRVAALLEKAEVSQYLIDVGGELRAGGTWTVGIVDPQNPNRTLRTVQLSDEALATSGVYRRAPGSGGGSNQHIISPRTGRPTETNWLSCSVIAPTCLEADGWATALMTTATDDTLVIAGRAGIVAILVDRTGKEMWCNFAEE
jgi:thiamine biosynthesis lipoprotein